MLTLYNSLTRKKEPFTPLDEKNIRMYVCGPTVYARPHLGNARSVVVYDVLFRLLRRLYGAEHVTCVRNITDVDDKINAAAIERGVSIQQLTQEVTGWFHEDMDALNCLRPDHEPHATEYISEMIAMIERLIASGNAYIAGGHVLFAVESRVQSSESSWVYGMLSGRTTEDQQAGARVAVESYKKTPGDFVLWKPADDEDDASSKFGSPWGEGRPGWHIECSAMSTELLGETFDLHGGGADLKFPHHENEIAQSCCANPGSEFAKVWVHNGFLTVNGEKMSKSLGNFITVRDLLDKGVHGEVIRFALLSSNYIKPLNWTDVLVKDENFSLHSIMHNIIDHNGEKALTEEIDYLLTGIAEEKFQEFIASLCDDLNFSKARAVLFDTGYLAKNEEISSEARYSLKVGLKRMCDVLGLDVKSLQETEEERMRSNQQLMDVSEIVEIESRITARLAARAAKNWAEADRIRGELKAQGVILEDLPDGTTDWRRSYTNSLK